MATAELRGRRHWPALRLVSLCLAIAFGLLLATLFARSVSIVITYPPSFDGAMNLQVASSIANGEGYRRNYASREAFPHEIQTVRDARHRRHRRPAAFRLPAHDRRAGIAQACRMILPCSNPAAIAATARARARMH